VEFTGFIYARTGRTPNYGECYLADETAATAFVESAVDRGH
jgi:hypothetical protein